MVTLKLAATLDGRIATADGESRWITGPAARREVHAQRARHDAVMVGSATARADDPALTVRGLGMGHQPVRVICDTRLSVADDPALTVRGLGMGHQPVRVICDTRLSVSTESRLGRTAREVPVWLCHGADAPEAARQAWTRAGARLLPCETGADGHLDIADALGQLGAAGLTRVFCEGGGTLAAALLSAGCADALVTFSAGLAIGAEGRPALGAMGLDRLAAAPRFTLRETRAIGDDAMQLWDRT